MGERDITTSELVKEEIKAYLANNIYNYAVLIDGEWGCGKTYFIKNEFMKKIDEFEWEKDSKDYIPKKPIYISLYGIKELEEIDDKITYNILNIKDNKIEKIAKEGATVFAQIAAKRIGIDINYKNVLSSIIDFKDYVLIFDDLERVECDLGSVLGYINKYVEHEGVKAVLIAHEEELDKKLGNKSKEDIESNDKMKSNSSTDDNKPDDDTTKVKVVNIKEKLIGKKIKYIGNYEQIFEGIISSLKSNWDNELVNRIKDSIDSILGRMDEFNHHNIRTFQFFLEKIDKIYKVFKDDDEIKKYCLDEIIAYTILVCVAYKSDSYDYKGWEDERLSICLNNPTKQKSKSIISFKFIDDYVINSFINDNQIRNLLNDRVTELKLIEADKNNSYTKLYKWNELEDTQELTYVVEALINEINEGKYDIGLFTNIMIFICQIYEVDLIDNNIIDRFKNAIEHRAETLQCKDIDDFSNIIHSVKVNFSETKNKKLLSFIDELMELCSKIKSESKELKSEFNNILKGNNFGEELLKYSERYQIQIIDNNTFLALIEMDDLIKRIKRMNNKELIAFRDALQLIYGFSSMLCKTERNYLKQMISQLREFLESADEQLKCYNLSRIISQLDIYANVT